VHVTVERLSEIDAALLALAVASARTRALELVAAFGVFLN
jgi:hypothetical protein